MDVERIGSTGGPKPSEKKERSSTPDSEEFREMMRTGKVGETEFEKPKKRRYQEAQEEGSTLTSPPPKSRPPAPPPPYEPQVPKDTPSSQAPTESQRSSTDDTSDTQQTDKSKDKTTQKKKKKKKEFEEVVVFKKDEMKAEKMPLKEEKKKIEKAKHEKLYIKEKAKKPKEEKEEKVVAPKEEKKIYAPPVKEKDKDTFEEDEGKKKKDEMKTEVSTVIEEMPQNIAIQTQSLTQILTPYLHPDIVPIFEKMVGTIIQIRAQGITRTEVLLNSPAFASSIFFGSSITLERYSTSPDSFNIFLRGPQQAVALFNENLDGLYDAFKRGSFNFKVGRLEAEHEKPLFKRKEKPGSKDTDAGTKR